MIKCDPKTYLLITISKTVIFKLIFAFLSLGGVFLGVKNNSKNFGNKKNIGLLSKILSKLTLFNGKIQKCWCFYKFIAMIRMEKKILWHKSHYLCIYSYKY